jgi:hypothetical protein
MLNGQTQTSQVIRIANAILASIIALFRGHFSLAQVNFKQKLYLKASILHLHTLYILCYMPPKEMKTN